MQLPLLDANGEPFWAGLEQIAIMRPKAAGLEVVLLSGRVGRFPRTAAEVITMFAAHSFVQVDRSEIVNTAHIKAVERERRKVLFVQEEMGEDGQGLTATVSAANMNKLRDWFRESASGYWVGGGCHQVKCHAFYIHDVKLTYEVNLSKNIVI